jgi:hypothetical protein
VHTNIIGISGKRGSGKDTVAAIIRQLQPEKNWQTLRFADKVKECAALLTGLPLELMHTQEGKRHYLPDYDMTVGQMQQRLGTEAIRGQVHDKAWIFATMSQVRPEGNYLITDVRFPNEVGCIEEAGGIVIRLVGDPMKQLGDGTRDDEHPSECALDEHPFTFIIHNVGTVAELEWKIKRLLLVELPTYSPSGILYSSAEASIK